MSLNKYIFLIAALLTICTACTNCSHSGRKSLKREKALMERNEKIGRHTSTDIESKTYLEQPCGFRENIFFELHKEVDGDTFWLKDNCNNKIKIRLIGINAPESKNMWNIKKEPYGVEAKEYLHSLIKDESIRLEFDVDSLDRYGRTLAYCYLRNDVFINNQIVKAGFAHVETFPPNIKYQNLFLESQRVARKNEEGIWKDNSLH